MQRGRGKVEFEDIRVGSGEVATREHKAKVSYSMSLHRGDVLENLVDYWIDLKRRESCVAGMRYGVEGMRVGGTRRIVVPPQLAYGQHGVPVAGIPPNAMLIFVVTLSELQPTHPIKQKLQRARERKRQQSLNE